MSIIFMLYFNHRGGVVMNHKVLNVSELYRSAKALYDKSVVGGNDSSADTILNNLSSAIQILKNSWEGKDAGVQINNVVRVYNGMVALRNQLISLSSDTTKIAANYRNIQNVNGAKGEELPVLRGDTRSTMGEYSDTRDTISITSEANNGKSKIDMAKNGLDMFENEVRKNLGDIMQNWRAGSGRDKANELFENFRAEVMRYKSILADVSQSISTAIQNYTF